MEIVRNWAFSICAASVCGAILNMILPEGSTQKTYKAVFCVFFLCVLISPLSEFEIPDFEAITENIDKIESENIENNEFSENSVSIIEDAVIKDAQSILAEEGIAAKDISVKINISENGGIDINKFVLTLDSVCDLDLLKKKIFQKTGIMPEIIISEENANGSNK